MGITTRLLQVMQNLLHSPLALLKICMVMPFTVKRLPSKQSKSLLPILKDATARTWDMYNPSSIHKYSGKPATYKLWSTFCSPLLAQEGSLVKKSTMGC